MTATKPSPPPEGQGQRQTPSRARTASLASSHTRTPVRSLTDPSSPKSITPPRPAGPRSPDVSRSAKARSERPGSSRTKFVTTFPADLVVPASPTLTSNDPTSQTSSTAFLPSQSDIPVDLDAPHAPYRPPEPVYDPTDEPLPDYIEAVVEEHPISDDEMLGPDSSPLGNKRGKGRVDAWQANLRQYNMISTDEDYDKSVERPQIGPGVMPRRLLALVHEHELLQPIITALPERGPKKTQASTSSLPGLPSVSSASESAPAPLTPATPDASASAPDPTAHTTPPEYDRIATMKDLWAACPGGAGDRREWYFCPLCWAWFRISCESEGGPHIPTMDEWQNSDLSQITIDEQNERVRTMGRHRDIIASRSLASQRHHHFHELNSLIESKEGHRLERVELGEEMNCFPHITMSWGDEQDWASGGRPRSTRLYLSCSSDVWFVVDGPVTGQLPTKLVNAFTAEKMSNPGPSGNGANSVNEAWELLSTLLVNPLFKGQRGWVKLDNKRFQSKIGASLTTSYLLYELGFACRQEEDVLRVGPLNPNDTIELQKVEQMDRYMLRTWVEISLFLLQFRRRNQLIADGPGSVSATRLEDSADSYLDLPLYPKTINPLPDAVRDACYDLGVTKIDIASTIEAAYELQIACDTSNIPKYLQALESISRAPMLGKEALQLKVATERSLNRYTTNDIRAAYDEIGYTAQHALRLGVDPEDAPEDYLLQLHKNATVASTNAIERAELARALIVIGKTRHSELMTRLGGSGQTFLSLEEAYRALSAPRDSVDDGLILQYEMAAGEFPGKIEHYRMCLAIIANANGEERPALQTYLETGSKGVEAPARMDIPVGLQNIGNTCYLNSILQYLYSIKPLREAVIAFDETAGLAKPAKPDVVRSRRFVQQLRNLFLQLYDSETTSVRPEEELAYLAVTRPEVDEIVQPSITVNSTLDSIPNIPSPSSTIVNSSPEPEESSFTPSPLASPRTSRSRSVLGKRASQDREEASLSDDDRQRLRSEGFEHIEEADSGMEVDRPEDDFDIVSHPKSAVRKQRATSPSAASDLAGLDLQSPGELSPNRQASVTAMDPVYEPPSVPPPLPPRPTIPNRKDSLAAGLRFGLQQDSAEVLINVLNQLELAFDPPNAGDEDDKASSNLIRDLYSCSFQQQNTYRSSDGTVETQPPKKTGFSHPIIGVEEEGKNLYDCLGELYLLPSEVEYEGKTGYTMDLMDTFPPMLYIQMRRSQYDPVTRRESKTNTHIAFEQTLSMDRFLVNVDHAKREESIAITRDMAQVRSRLQRLKYNKPMAIPLTFQHAREALEALQSEHDLDITQDFLEALRVEDEEATVAINGLQDRLPVLKRKLDALWENDREYEYELVSVFMHRGKTSGAGHYWTYQSHLPTHAERFFKYNDETVTEVPAAEVLEDRTGSDANPALLCYVRKGRDMVDTLHRRVLEMKDVVVPEVGPGDEE